MIPEKSKGSYWAVLEECLRAFHGFSTAEAQKKAKAFRDRIDQAPRGMDRNLIYHEEPFDLACDLAGNRLDLAGYRRNYERILAAHGADFNLLGK